MKQQRSRGATLWGALMASILLCLCLVPTAWAQRTQGTVSVIVLDPSGAVVPGAQLKLVDLATNDTRTAATQETGNYDFVNLNFGQYKLTVSRDGFETQTYDVLVQSARTTDVKATLKVGAASTVVQVEGVAPLVEGSTNAINTTIDMKQIEDLPLGGRSLTQLATLAAGYNGTFNGLPSAAQGNSMDGVVGNTTRWRYQTNNSGLQIAAVPRLENIAEMVVSTDQIDMNQGFGNSTMQVTYVTRRGSNEFHGRAYEDFRSSALNAYNWGATQKGKYHQNEVGASVGGPIFKDKLFFFGSFSVLDVPGGGLVYRDYFAPAVTGCLSGSGSCLFTYGSGGYTANLLTDVIGAYNTAHGTNLPTTVNDMVRQRILQVAGFMGNKGQQYSINPTDQNLRTWYWMGNNPQRTYYPTVRVDYNISQNWRLNLAYNQTKFNGPSVNQEHWPGDGRGAGNKSNNSSTALGLETTISPTLINQFKLGYLYTAAWFGQGGSTDFYTEPTIQYGYGDYDSYFELPNSRMQPVFSMSDSVTWAKKAHTFSLGFTAYREVNKYWDPPEGYTLMHLGLATGDPAIQAITKESIATAAGFTVPVGGCNDNVVGCPNDDELGQALQMYATMAGRIDNFWGRHPYVPSTGLYAVGDTPDPNGVASNVLNELVSSWGLFFQDSFKMKRNLTVNYGLRWDFVNPDKDMTGKYHSLTDQDLFGPTGIWDLFNPGPQSLTGTNDPVYTARPTPYSGWKKTPQPAIGIAWTPRNDGNLIERLLGGEKTVVRAGYSFRNFQEPQQFVWDMGSSYGLAFFQEFGAYPSMSGDLGTFIPGSVTLGGQNWLPKSCDADPSGLVCMTKSPAQYDKVIHMAESTWLGPAAATIKNHIRQPYTQSWNFGIQRELGPSRAIEIRYNGNRTVHQWLAVDVNEVNIFENHFLEEFQHAQENLALNGGTSFAKPVSGGYDLPIMTAAHVNFTDSTFLTYLRNGRAGSFASDLATTPDYYCWMVGTAFSPCGTSYGAGAGYPINFWQANPYAMWSWTGAAYMGDQGYSNYNGLQMEFRQRQWHGMTMTANYTWSKTLGVATARDWTGSFQQFTVRNLRSSYRPLETDLNHVVHINATFDLPVGKGKQFLNMGGIVDKVLGGWTVSTIYTFQTGSPFRINGNNNTFNNKRDGGVVLNGITPSDFVAHMGRYVDSQGRPYFLDPTWVSQIKSNGSITAFNTPGEWGTMLWLHGPHQTYTDVGISKAASITEQLRFKFQMEMLNAFNHPTFGWSTVSLTSSGLGRSSQNATSRRIEFRANLEF